MSVSLLHGGDHPTPCPRLDAGEPAQGGVTVRVLAGA